MKCNHQLKRHERSQVVHAAAQPPVQRPTMLTMTQKTPVRVEQRVVSQRKPQLPKKPSIIQRHGLQQQRHHHQPHPIQVVILNVKMKVSIQIQKIARNMCGAWIAVHPIWVLWLISSRVHPG